MLQPSQLGDKTSSFYYRKEEEYLCCNMQHRNCILLFPVATTQLGKYFWRCNDTKEKVISRLRSRNRKWEVYGRWQHFPSFLLRHVILIAYAVSFTCRKTKEGERRRLTAQENMVDVHHCDVLFSWCWTDTMITCVYPPMEFFALFVEYRTKKIDRRFHFSLQIP